MKVIIFDEENEMDLEQDINNFIKENDVEIIDIKYQVATAMDSIGDNQVYCFSALLMYRGKNENN